MIAEDGGTGVDVVEAGDAFEAAYPGVLLVGDFGKATAVVFVDDLRLVEAESELGVVIEDGDLFLQFPEIGPVVVALELGDVLAAGSTEEAVDVGSAALVRFRENGADAIGMVFYSKSPRYISIEDAQEIVSHIPPFASTVGLFVNSSSDTVRNVLSEVPLDLLQFHGDEDESFCKSFNRPYIKAVRVKADTDLLQICHQYSSARGILLDSYKKGTPGGTGETFDWSMIPAKLPLPVILAGGLDANNVAEAVSAVHPWAVDVSSGVEHSAGKKDRQKVEQFIRAVERSRKF